MVTSPSRCPTCGRRHKRGSPANAKLWAIYSALSSKLRPDGKVYSPEHFHLYYKQRFLGATDFALPNGQVLIVPLSTADLSVEEFSAYLGAVEADAAERGVFLDE
jgi:hypothetical protein